MFLTDREIFRSPSLIFYEGEERERDEGSRVIIISAMMIPGVCFYNAIVFLFSLSLSERWPILSPS